MMGPKVVAIYGSPRRFGNTERLLREAVKGAREAGAEIKEFWLKDMKISPCLEIYGCKSKGRCVIEDDFHLIADALEESKGIMIATPVFFYNVSAHTKMFIDRCQSFWVRKYWIDKASFGSRNDKRFGLLISVGATRGKKLFDGLLLTVKYFFDAIDTTLWKSLLYRGLDGAEDVLKFPEYLQEAYQAGFEFVYQLK